MRPPFKMTPRRREVLYHVAFGAMHGSRWQRQLFNPHGGVQVWLYRLNGVDVSEIVKALARAKLVRLWYRPERPHPAETIMCLCITDKGIEELLS